MLKRRFKSIVTWDLTALDDLINKALDDGYSLMEAPRRVGEEFVAFVIIKDNLHVTARD